MPWNDSSVTSIDASDLNPAPLTEVQRVRVRDGHFFDASGRRVRFLGTNITSSAAFTASDKATSVAARLHKFGFNIVRLHHMDASWANPSIFGFDHDSNAGPNPLAPESLELLDNFVSELKKNGIYVDLNLHVSRPPTPAEGFPDTDKLPELGKIVAYFDPQFIALQKDYARQILGHVNPHTGLKWADDPAVALVELNNEDSLVAHAFDGSLQKLPPHYRAILERGWNTFLRARYADDAVLKAAWQSEKVGENIVSNPRFAENLDGWELEQQAETNAEISRVPIDAGDAGPEGDAIKIDVEKIADENWKVQLHQTGLDLQNGVSYTVSFWAKSDEPRAASAYLALDRALWTQLGGELRFDLVPQWKRFRFAFRAHDAQSNHTRISFPVGNATGAVYLADVNITPGVAAEIASDWSLQNANYDLPGAVIVPAQARDWVDYLAVIEKSYVETMTDFLKNELAYRGLVTCSQASYGNFAGIARESRTDWIDMHAYWQHPNFPGRAWDFANWNIPNTPMTDDDNAGTLLELATHRVAGKPFTVSEYNHAAPNDYASETVPLILGYAAAQDWDGVFFFSYNGDRNNWNPGRIRGFFDMDSDPNKMAFLPSMARAFLSGHIAPFAATTTLQMPRESLPDLTAQTLSGNAWNAVVSHWKTRGLTRGDLLGSRVQMQLVSGSGQSELKRTGAPGGAWSWNWRGKRGIIALDAPTAKSFVGRLGDNFHVGPLQASDWRVADIKSSNAWAAFTLVSRDDKPVFESNSLLLTALNRAENLDMKWNSDRTSVGNSWGEGPPQIEVPAAHIEIKTKARNARVFQLSSTGKRGGIVTSQLKEGTLSFEIGPAEQTLWWEIVTDFRG